jgi:hypothetical protein
MWQTKFAITLFTTTHSFLQYFILPSKHTEVWKHLLIIHNVFVREVQNYVFFTNQN